LTIGTRQTYRQLSLFEFASVSRLTETIFSFAMLLAERRKEGLSGKQLGD